MGSLKEQFEEFLHYPYDEYWKQKKSRNNTVDERTIMSLIDLCTDTDDIPATKMSFDRIEGMLETPIHVKVPKFYVRYINAKDVEHSEQKALEAPESSKAVEGEQYDPATAKLRETMQRMREMPEQIIPAILRVKKAVQEGKDVKLTGKQKMPQVKHVIVANLLKNARRGRFSAINLIFDQLDGRLTRTITLLGGEDVYVDDYSLLTAPAGAIKDDNGYYIAENKTMTTAWLKGFANSSKGLEMLVEGLDDE
jgi:hypothetical protein